MQRVASGDRHDTALGIYSRRGAQQAGVIDEKILMSVDFSKRIDRANISCFAHNAGGKQVDGHQIG
jgi:hypothetical protein